MSNVWEEIGIIEPDLANPRDIVRGMFEPIRDVTGDKVYFEIEKVNFFPEEVVFTSLRTSLSTMQVSVGSIFDDRKELPHPEFGYNPESARAKESFRYRLLLMPVKGIDFKFELFKFKFPLYFYPVHFYIEKNDFPELSDRVTNDGINVSDQEELRDLVGKIIKSDSTLKLIKRIMAL